MTNEVEQISEELSEDSEDEGEPLLHQELEAAILEANVIFITSHLAVQVLCLYRELLHLPLSVPMCQETVRIQSQFELDTLSTGVHRLWTPTERGVVCRNTTGMI
jgi:hypothetical protein